LRDAKKSRLYEPSSYPFLDGVVDRRSEVHIHATVLVDRLARPERIAQERELHHRMRFAPVDVLTVDDVRLVRVKLETALLQSFTDSAQHQLSLSPALAMHHTITRRGIYDNMRTAVDTVQRGILDPCRGSHRTAANVDRPKFGPYCVL